MDLEQDTNVSVRKKSSRKEAFQKSSSSGKDVQRISGKSDMQRSSSSGKDVQRLSGKLPKPEVNTTLYINGGRRRSSISLADAVKALAKNNDAHASSLQEGRKAMLCTLTIEDRHDHTGDIADISLLELLRSIEDNIKSTVDESTIQHTVTDRDGIAEIRGRDLCRLTKFGNETDTLVYLVKQHCLIVSFRYDMRAVIESNRITFVAHKGEEAYLERIKMFMLGNYLVVAQILCDMF